MSEERALYGYSKIQGHNYIVQESPQDLSEKLNRRHTDAALEQIVKDAKSLRGIMLYLHDQDYAVYEFMRKYIFSGYWRGLEFEDGKSYLLDTIIEEAQGVLRSLHERSDEIVPQEKIITLIDLGFQADYASRGKRYEKVLEDTDEREVVEEVLLCKEGEVLHRKRTTIWTKQTWGKSSSSIRYRNVPTSKKLFFAIHTTFKDDSIRFVNGKLSDWV